MASPRHLLRPSLAVVLAISWTLAAVVVSSFLALGSESLGWLWVGSLVAIGLVAAVRLWGSVRRGVPIGIAVAIALGIGVLTWYTSPPTHERITATADTVDVPDGWEQVSEDEYGNTWCFQGCPELVREYTVSDNDLDQARAEALISLEADGWSTDESDDERLTRGRWQVWVEEVTYTETPRISLTFQG